MASVLAATRSRGIRVDFGHRVGRQARGDPSTEPGLFHPGDQHDSVTPASVGVLQRSRGCFTPETSGRRDGM